MNLAGPVPLQQLCRLVQVSRAGFYRWRETAPPTVDPDLDLRDEIQRIALESPSYGWPRITAELRRRGWKANHKRVYRILREDNLLCLRRRRKFVVTTDSNHDRPVYPNLASGMVLTGIDQLWVADITYIPTGTGFLFLAVVLDAWGRRVVGWAMASHLKTTLVLQALEMALGQKKPQAVIHHSDQGTQYTSIAFGIRCKQAGVRPSMGSAGDCFDNAMCESFFATLECELLERERFRNQAEGKMKVFDFIEGWYNPRRRHSALDYRSPVEYERSHVRAA